jgi:hypothetical protein
MTTATEDPSNRSEPISPRRENLMIKLAVCYMRYAVVALATVGFGRDDN